MVSASDEQTIGKGKNRATTPSWHVHFEDSGVEEEELPDVGYQYGSRDTELQFEREADDTHKVSLTNIRVEYSFMD